MDQKIFVPEGLTLTGLVRRGMASGFNTVQKQGDAAGLKAKTYRAVRRVLLIADACPLTEVERTRVAEALAAVDQERQLGSLRKIGDLVDKYLPNKSTVAINGSVSRRKLLREEKKRRRLDNTVFQIQEACNNNDEMVIPSLDDQARREVIDILLDSMKSLVDLLQKVRTQ